MVLKQTMQRTRGRQRLPRGGPGDPVESGAVDITDGPRDDDVAVRGDGYNRLPMVRMTNVGLLPGDSSLEEMIAATEDGLERSTVTVRGPVDGPAMVFAHGFGCDKAMWRLVAPSFEATHRVVLFDHVGAGGGREWTVP